MPDNIKDNGKTTLEEKLSKILFEDNAARIFTKEDWSKVISFIPPENRISVIGILCQEDPSIIEKRLKFINFLEGEKDAFKK